MEWWIWAIIGLVLLSSEVIIPLDFFLFFLGAAAILVSGLVASELTPSLLLLSVQISLFAILSLLLLVTVRKPMVAHLKKTSGDTGTNAKGRYAKMSGDIAAGESGKARFRGTSWTLRNLTSETLLKGKSYEISRTEGLSLIIEDKIEEKAE